MMTSSESRHVVTMPEFLPFPENRAIPGSHLAVLMGFHRWKYLEQSVASLTQEIEHLNTDFPDVPAVASRTVYSVVAEFLRRGLVERRVQKRHAGGRWLKPLVVYRLSGSPVDLPFALRLVSAILAKGWALPGNLGPSIPSARDEWARLSTEAQHRS